MSEQNNKSKEAIKVEKAYVNSLNKALSLLGDNKFEPVKRIPQDKASTLMEELFSEDIKTKETEFKQKMKNLLEEKVKFDNFLKQKRLELDKVILERKKQFTKQIEEVTSLIDGIDKIKQDYLNALTPVENIEEDNNEA